jgi:hypothetical protein
MKKFLVITMAFKNFFRVLLTFSKKSWLSVISWLSQLRQLILGYTVWLRYQMIRYLGKLVVLLLGYIKEILAILFGSIIISWLIFNRLFREHLPASIPTFNTIYSWGFLIYFSLFVVTLLLFLFLLLLKIKPKVLSASKNEDIVFMKQIATDIQNIIIYSFRKLHLVISVRIPKYVRKILFISTKFRKLQPYYKWLVIIFVMLPPIVVGVTFLVDIVIFGRFNYFYTSLVILLLPLIFKGIIGIFRHVFEQKNDDVITCLIMLRYDEYEEDRAKKGLEAKILAFYIVNSADEFEACFSTPITEIYPGILQPINKLISTYNLSCLLIYLFCYTSGFGYIVFHGFF